MKRHLRRTLAALAAPAAAGAMVMASPATAAVTTTAAPAAALRCHASMSNSRPEDYTTIYVNVGTVRNARRHHRRPLQDGQPEARRQGERRRKREDRLLHQRRDARLPGERDRYGHVRQQPRHLRDVVHTAPVTGRRGTNGLAR